MLMWQVKFLIYDLIYYQKYYKKNVSWDAEPSQNPQQIYY